MKATRLQQAGSKKLPFSGWSTFSPRKEIEPSFTINKKGGMDAKGSLVIKTDSRDYLQGSWYMKYAVTGGTYYKIEAWYRATNVPHPHRSILTKVLWRGDEKDGNADQYGGIVPCRPNTTELDYIPTWLNKPSGDEFPTERDRSVKGWHCVSDIYLAPEVATFAVVELSLQWAPHAKVEWSKITLKKAVPLPPRKVRLAAVHFDPGQIPVRAKSVEENLRLCEPYINEAGKQKADLVVLGEHIQSQGIGKAIDHAETIPGPSTRQLGAYAKANNLYLVAGLTERDGPRIHNTAVLLGPTGKFIGKYRKTALTTGEIADGMMPGTEYPVFQTRFGKLGMMVCYDGEFVEPAQMLTRNGAEVIAWPCYGNPWKMAQALPLFNQVHIVMSTYMAYDERPDTIFGISGVFNREGNVIAHATKYGTIAVAEVDLNEPFYHIGYDMKRGFPHQRPVWQNSDQPEGRI